VGRLLVWLLFFSFLAMSTGVSARQSYQFGGVAGVSWTEVGTPSFIDAEKVPGSIRPLSTDLEQNLVASMRDRGGDITSLVSIYTLPANWADTRVFAIDGDSTTAFVHPPRINFFRPGFFYTTPMYFDLGAPFPIERVVFSTRPNQPGNKIRQYRFYLNDGSPESRDDKGDIVWNLVRNEKDNLNARVELDIEPQVVRHLYLHPLEVAETWEVAEFEVYGQGFVPEASYLSNPIDLGAQSSLGRIRWSGQRPAGSKILIQTRSGSDDQPEVYWRKTGVGDEEVSFVANGAPMTRADYLALPQNVRGSITQDLDNWSVWHTYEYEDGLAGTRILSPGPRQFVQLAIDFASNGLQGGQLDSLSFEYSQPPVVAAAVGEIHPASVNPAEIVQFTYAVRARLDAGQAGFNRLEVRTPARLEAVRAVRIDRREVDFDVEFDAANPHQFSVDFARIAQDQTLLEVDFDARVFVYGTVFSASVVDGEADEVAQEVTPGDAVTALLGDDLVVRTALEGNLLAEVAVEPNPFTPNGDGINDQAQITYTLLRLTEEAPLGVEIYDLNGQQVRALRGDRGASALYQLVWDGRDDGGNMVPPGLYIYRISVEAGSGSEEKLGHIALVY
jgi:hypothetical protein